MRHYQTIQIPAKPARQEEQLQKMTCDLCSAKLIARSYNINQVNISCESGKSYPEGGDKTTQCFDMCEKCFVDKLVPLLESWGMTSYETEIDW